MPKIIRVTVATPPARYAVTVQLPGQPASVRLISRNSLSLGVVADVLKGDPAPVEPPMDFDMIVGAMLSI